jgi:hypothetical protein
LANALSLTAKREYGTTPNGNPMNGMWVLQTATGEMVDFDQYRHDLASRNGLTYEDFAAACEMAGKEMNK